VRRFSRRMLGALAIGLGLAVQPLLGAMALAQQPKPNILFILADNTGYGDLGVYGGGELRGRRASTGLPPRSGWGGANLLGGLVAAREEYKGSLAKHPNPPAANLTRF
jgi:hypothetical protein